MNITTLQLQALRCLLSKEDKQQIAIQTDLSFRTVEAVINGIRTNDEIEQMIFKFVKLNIARLYRIVATIETQNVLQVDANELKSMRDSPAWMATEYYVRYTDIYIRLCTNEWNIDELYAHLKQHYKDILTYGAYCCDLICRLIGLTDEESVKYYNNYTF